MAKASEVQLVSKFRVLIKESDVNDASFNDEVLVCFIRSRKNDLHRALSLLKNYIKMSKHYPELLADLGTRRLRPVLELGHFLLSPSREQNGCHILIVKAGHWDVHKCSLDDAFRGFVYSFQKLASKVETQTNGLVLVFDFHGFGIGQVRHVTPAFLKKLADLVQNVFPIRLQGIHIMHEPWVFKILLSMIWPFLSAKMRSRIFTHGYSYEKLHEQVDPSSLPSEYRGSHCSMDEMNLANAMPEDSRNIFEDLRF